MSDLADALRGSTGSNASGGLGKSDLSKALSGSDLSSALTIGNERNEESWLREVANYIISGPDGGPGVFQDPVAWAQSGPGPVEATKRVVGGATSGMTFGAVEPWKEELGQTAGYRAGEFLGVLAPWGAISSGVGAIPAISKLPALAQPAVRGALAGAGVGALEQGVKAAKGEGFDPSSIATDAALFGAVEGIPSLIGAGIRGARAAKAAKNLKATTSTLEMATEPAAIEEELRGLIKNGRMNPMKEADLKVYAEKLSGIRSQKLKNIQQMDARVIVNEATATPTTAVTAGELQPLIQAARTELPESLVGDITRKAGLEVPIRMMERLGLKETMLYPAREAEHEAAMSAKEVIDGFRSLVKKNIPFGFRGKSSKRIMEYAVAQQKNGVEVLAKMGIKDIPELTGVEESLYNHMRGYLEKAFGDLNFVRKQSGVHSFGYVDNYFTFWRALEGELENGFNLLKTKISKAAQTPFSYARSRIRDGYGPLDLDAFAVFERYVQQAERHKLMTPVVAKFRQMLDGEFSNGFKLMRENPDLYHELNNWVNYVAGQPSKLDTVLPKWLNKSFRKLNKNLAYSVLAYNFRSIGIQPTAIINGASEIGPKWILSGIGKTFNKGAREFAAKNSYHLGTRAWDVGITEAMSGIAGQMRGIKRAIGSAGIKPLQWLDQQTAVATWLGAYEKATKQFKMAQREAARFADDVVVKTQASASRIDVAPIQRSAAGKALTVFQTFVINNWGFITRDVLGLGNVSMTNKEAMRKALTYLGGVMATNILFEDVLDTRSPFPAPIHEIIRRADADDSEVGILMGALRESIEVVPVVGGGMRYGSNIFGAGAQLGSDVAEVVAGRGGNIKAVETLGKIFGVPGTTQIKKLYREFQED